jgi:hypothetical protein
MRAAPAIHAAALAFVSTIAAGCGAPNLNYHLTGVTPVYTLVNLRPDETRAVLYSINYQREGLIPLCSPVRIERVTRKKMIFTVASTGRRYSYVFHNAMRMAPEQHLDLIFGPQCPQGALDALSPEDQEGVRAGQVSPGMTRSGVIAAIGYPPDHATPDLGANAWRYWLHRYKTMLVVFDGDVVTDITY